MAVIRSFKVVDPPSSDAVKDCVIASLRNRDLVSLRIEEVALDIRPVEPVTHVEFVVSMTHQHGSDGTMDVRGDRADGPTVLLRIAADPRQPASVDLVI